MKKYSEVLNEAKYLLRFDDICSTMNWKIWNHIEEILISKKIYPILAVVPDNKDPKLKIHSPNPDFWSCVRRWQGMGWAIGLHGYQHKYINTNAGILKLTAQSEFAGLSYNDQFKKIHNGLSIFADEGVKADCWVAPSHSFDWNTVAALSEHGINVISDGFATGPYLDRYDSIWVPQQFSRMRRMPAGIWTFCYHHNNLNQVSLSRFRESLNALSPNMIALKEAIVMAKSKRTSIDYMVHGVRRLASILK